MFFKGVINFEGSGIIVVLVLEKGHHYLIRVKLYLPCTKNMVDYKYLSLNLKLALDINVRELLVFRNSNLLVRQV